MMSKAMLKKKLSLLIDELPERKLEILYELARFLQSQRSRESQDLFRTQMSSNAYRQWLSAENDIYDEVFKNEINKR
jgi:hypothetical protein